MGERKELGMAVDFYRLRLLHVDDADAPDLEWREDILYRDPPVYVPAEGDCYRIDVVDTVADELVRPIAFFVERGKAQEWLEAAEEDLEAMTRTEFEERYFSVSSGPCSSEETDIT